MAWEHELTSAKNAAIKGAEIALTSALHLDIQVKESKRDIVTAVDLHIQTVLTELLADSAIPVLSEEDISDSSYAMNDQALRWVIDPIDGSVNFANQLDYYAVSIGLCRGLEFLVGAVSLPKLGELYLSHAPDYSQLNEKALKHEHRSAETSLIAASFSGFAGDPSLRQAQYQLFGALNDSTRGCLRLGSTAVNLCFVASNRLQLAYGFNAKIWDVAGGLAVAQAAGCHVIVVPSGDQFSVNYIAGSKDTVGLALNLAIEHGLMKADSTLMS